MANSSGSRAEAAYARAVAAFQEGSLEAARRLTNDALAEDPSHPGARALRTRLDARMGAGRTSMPPGRGHTPEATSVDPTILIDRAASRPPDFIEPTVMIQRDDFRRQEREPAPTPLPSRGSARPAPEPTLMIPPKRPAAAPDSRQASGGLLQRVKDLAGASAPPRRPASGRTAPVRQPGGFWTPTTRGMAMVAGGVVVASLVVLAVVWVWPSGNTLTIIKPTGGTISGAGLTCGSRGSDCVVKKSPDETIELQPVADSGYVFTGFTGPCAPMGRVTMAQSRECGATFGRVGDTEGPGTTPTTWVLTIDKPTGGTVVGDGISCGTLDSRCTATIRDGTELGLTVQTDTGFMLKNFTGDCSADGRVVMSGARRCGASFAPSAIPVANPTPPSGRPTAGGQPTGPKPPPPTPPPAPPVQAGSSQPGQAGAPPAGGVQPPPPVGPTAPPAPPGPTGIAVGPTGSVQGEKAPEMAETPEANAKKEIEKLVKTYCAELETLQPERLKKLYPQVDVALHRELFRQYKSLKCALAGPPEYDRLDASPAGGAQIKVGMKQTLETKSGGAPKVQETIVTIVVSRMNFQSPWLIDRMQAALKPK